MGRRRIKANFRFKPFSRKQTKILTWWCPGSGVSQKDGIIADGAIRSGKTVCMALSFVMWSMDNFDAENFGMAGKTIASFQRNVLEPLQKMLPGRGYKYAYHRGDHQLEVRRAGVVNYYYIFGGHDESSQDLIQGITLAGMFFDEVALMPKSFVDQATARCSVAGSKYWFNCNPAGPSHWFKTEWLDKLTDKNLLHERFRLDDNLSLPDDIKDRYRRMYTGVFYRRYILGEWCVAEGIIYPMYQDAMEKRFSGPAADWGLSIDYGTQNAFAALLWAKDGNTWHVTDEYRYSGRDEGKQKTDAEYLADLEKFVRAKIPPAWWQRSTKLRTIVDPSAASFIAALRQAPSGLFRVIPAINDVKDGIQNTATCLQMGRIKISETCNGTLKEFEGYVWDDKCRTEDRPVKIEDHCMDALRYWVQTNNLVKQVEKKCQYNFFGG